MRIDIMLDIETLGTKQNTSVFQIAGASFDIATGEVKDTINLIGDVEKYHNLSVDGSTLKWWINTDKELFRLLLNSGTLTEKELIKKLISWIKNQSEDVKSIYLWGNGILFDNAKIKNLCEKYEIEYPIFYRNDRDVRTILELTSMKTGLSENEIKSVVTNENERKHDAFDDVMYQIRLVCKCYDILTKKEE